MHQLLHQGPLRKSRKHTGQPVRIKQWFDAGKMTLDGYLVTSVFCHRLVVICLAADRFINNLFRC